MLLIEPVEKDMLLIKGAILSQSPLYDVEFASDAAQALAKVRDQSYDVVVVDNDLPDSLAARSWSAH